MTTELTRLLAVAHTAVDLGDTHIRAHRPRTLIAKGDRDMATDVDLEVERGILSALAQETPDIPVLGEEEGGVAAPTHWVLDPVDGTANLTHNLPLTGVALALVRDGEPVLGVIALPLLGRRYSAARGFGAWRDRQPITASPTVALADAIVAIGDYGTGPDAGPRNATALALHAQLAARAQRVRMLGSAAVDLAWVADGTLDASITLGNRSWDMAAGSIIAREAGAKVVDLDGSTHRDTSRFTIAATPPLLRPILAAVRHATTVTATPSYEWRPGGA